MNFKDLQRVMDPDIRRAFRRKADFIEWARSVDGRVRVGGPKGKGRITAKAALALLD